MIDINSCWEMVRANAQKAFFVNMVYETHFKHHRYKVADVMEDKIIIDRLDGTTKQELNENTVKKAARVLNEKGGRIRRRTLISPTVAEETAFVLFHPQLSWTNDKLFIIDLKV